MIDSHFHIWRLARGDYGWLTPALAPIHRDVSIADWQAEAAPVGVTCGILVQAAPTEAETAFLLEAASAHPKIIAGVVGWADLASPHAADRIEVMARDGKLVGLRPMLHDLPDPAWILDERIAPALEAMMRFDLTFDALVRPVHLPHILALMQRHPQLRIVVDHGAKPDIKANAFEPWATDMASVAQHKLAFCKVSGLLTEAAHGAGATDLRPYVDHLASVFGASRLLWGSDWPVLNLAADYATWHSLSRTLIGEKALKIVGQTAFRAYPRVKISV